MTATMTRRVHSDDVASSSTHADARRQKAGVVPPLRDATIAFGLLEIVWLAWVGIVLVATRPQTVTDHPVKQP